MMKRIIFLKTKRYYTLMLAGLSAVFLFSACATEEKALTGEEEEVIRRKDLGVKTQTKWSRDVVNQIQHYDREGRLIDELWLNPNGVVVTRRVLEYEETEGLLVKTTWYKGREILKSRYHYTYDSEGNLTEEKWLTPFEEIRTRTFYSYENSLLIKAVKYNRFDSLIGTSLYHYKEDKLSEFIAKDRRNNVTTRQLYFYNDEGQLTKEEWLDRKGDIITRKIYRYEDGYKTEEIEYRNDEFVHLLEYEYKDNGLIKRETWIDEEGSILFENLYTYDYY